MQVALCQAECKHTAEVAEYRMAGDAIQNICKLRPVLDVVEGMARRGNGERPGRITIEARPSSQHPKEDQRYKLDRVEKEDKQ